MVHSHNGREGSGSPSRKRSRSPASEHSPDAPGNKRRSLTPPDSADASRDRWATDFTRLPPRHLRRLFSSFTAAATTFQPLSALAYPETPLPDLDLSTHFPALKSGPSSLSVRAPNATQDPSDRFGLATVPNSTQFTTDPQHQRPSRSPSSNSSCQRGPTSQRSSTSSEEIPQAQPRPWLWPDPADYPNYSEGSLGGAAANTSSANSSSSRSPAPGVRSQPAALPLAYPASRGHGGSDHMSAPGSPNEPSQSLRPGESALPLPPIASLDFESTARRPVAPTSQQHVASGSRLPPSTAQQPQRAASASHTARGFRHGLSDPRGYQDGLVGWQDRHRTKDLLSDQVRYLKERCREQWRHIEELERDKSDIRELCDRRNAELRAQIDALKAQLADAQRHEQEAHRAMLEARLAAEEHEHAAQQALRDLGEAREEIAAGRLREEDYQTANLRLAADYRRPHANLNTSRDRTFRPGELSSSPDDGLVPTTPVEATTPRQRSPIPARVRPRRTRNPSRVMPPSSPGQSSPTPAPSSSSRPRLRVSVRSAYQSGNPVVVYSSRLTRQDVEEDAVATFDGEEVSDSEKDRNEEASAEDDDLADLVRKEATTPVLHSRARSNSRSA
ncbi:uncharacterized protein SCHCODRAFT_02669202 [Schizophyllum commune H4-8]|nr:uncharacterized protein SCHCODRAFT_02669202 [Schizophyllum commune H4-8]KAI5889975.1 hypothetical protein SCHCODRAFT_02669202 [Schizophyllum commune H4-8]